MKPDKLVAMTLQGLKDNRFEIYPGIARVIKIMIRLAPNLIFNQMAKIADKALAKDNLK